MPKRKRSPPVLRTPNPLTSQKKLCTQCLSNASKSLLAALRFSATSERQKHSRRKKTAQSNNDAKALDRIEREYTVLKTLDLEKVADQHLRKRIGKVKSLHGVEALKGYLSGGSIGGEEKGYEGRSLAKDPATLNVLARLCKTQGVTKVVDEVIRNLKNIVAENSGIATHQEETEELKQKHGSLNTPRTEDVDESDVMNEADDPYSVFQARIAEPSSAEEDSADSVMDDDRPPSIGESESESENGADADLEAESEDDSSEEFQGFSDDSYEETEPLPLIATSSDTSSPDFYPEPTGKSSLPNTQLSLKPSKDAPTMSSAFIPALSHAAYISGSESEASDLDIDIAPQKKRRGQRARQKIAEAKYGAKAKHLEKVERNKGWDAKRGAVDNNRRGQIHKGKDGKGPPSSGGNAEPLGQKRSSGAKRDDKGALHPSWQAAKAAKESKKLKIDVKDGKAPGKKIVFD